VLDTLFPALTATAILLWVPAWLALPGTGRHAHVAESGSSARRARVVGAAVLLGLAASGVSALIGTGPMTAVVVAGVVAGAIGLIDRRHPSWAVRGLVAWTLVWVAAIGLLGWLLHRTLVSPASAPALMTAGLAWLVLLYVLVGLRAPIRTRIEALAVRDVGSMRTDAGLRGPLLRAGTALAAAGLLGVVTVPEPASEPDRAPSQAGRTSTPPPADPTSSSTSPPRGSTTLSVDGPKGAGSTTPRPTGAAGDAADGSESRSTTTGATSVMAVPTSSVAPSTAEASSTADPVKATKTPGHVKNSAKRPSGVPSPTPGGPSQP
jgi:hypothetical protein